MRPSRLSPAPIRSSKITYAAACTPTTSCCPSSRNACGQRRQLRIVARVEDATDFLLVLSDAAPQFGLGESRALEGLQDRDLGRDLRRDGNRNQAPSLCLCDRHRQSPPGIGQQRQAERLLCLLDRVSFAVALRYRLRDVREAYDHAGFVARFEPRGINERSIVFLTAINPKKRLSGWRSAMMCRAAKVQPRMRTLRQWSSFVIPGLGCKPRTRNP